MEQGRFTSSGTLTFSDTNSSSYLGVSTGTGFTNQGLIYNTSSNVGMGDPFTNQKLTVTSSKMKQVKAALFTVTRNEKTNEIIDSEFVKEFWVKQKPGVSFEVAASFVLGYAINPDNEIIREVLTMSLY
jgi:hypothetical protein